MLFLFVYSDLVLPTNWTKSKVARRVNATKLKAKATQENSKFDILILKQTIVFRWLPSIPKMQSAFFMPSFMCVRLFFRKLKLGKN